MNPQHWAQQNERGNRFFLNITRLIVKYCPLSIIRVATFLVVSYFYLTSKNSRKNIRYYHQNLEKVAHISLPSHSVFKQFLAFGTAIVDRFAVWQHKIQYTDLIIDDKDHLYDEIDTIGGRGQLLISSHFGNIEICRALINSGHHRNFRLNILVHNKHAEIFNKTLVKAGADDLSLIQVEDLDTQKMLELNERIEKGEWIAIAADRIPIRGQKTELITFLGEEAPFPQGPWLLSSLLKTDINTIFCLKEHNKYRFKLRKFSPQIQGRGVVRQQNIRIAMQKYADLLAKECAKNPLLWFNFYDFWNIQK